MHLRHNAAMQSSFAAAVWSQPDTSLCIAVLYCQAADMQKQQYINAKRHSLANTCGAAAIYASQIGRQRIMQLLQATTWQLATLLCRLEP